METVYALMDSLLPLEAFRFSFMKNAFLAVLLLTPLLGLLGTMAVNHQMAFFSDALGHSAVTGIGLGILLEKNVLAQGTPERVFRSPEFETVFGTAVQKEVEEA